MKQDRYCKCGSESLHFVKYEMKNKVKILRKQCLSCGYLLTRNYKRNLVDDFDSLPYVDEIFRENNYNKNEFLYNCRIIFNDYREKHFERKKNYYRNTYLKSNEWRQKRNLIMDFYQNICQDCKNTAQDVHHIHYNNIFCEKFEDLIPLCRSCHEKRHKITPITLEDIKVDKNVLKYSFFNHKGILLKEGDVVNQGGAKSYLIKEGFFYGGNNSSLMLYNSEGEISLSFYFDDNDNYFNIEGNIYNNPELIFKIL